MCRNCSECQNKNKKQLMYITYSELVVFMYWTGKSMNNLLSYRGLVDARISPSEKDLPVLEVMLKYSSLSVLRRSVFVVFTKLLDSFPKWKRPSEKFGISWLEYSLAMSENTFMYYVIMFLAFFSLIIQQIV